MQVDPRGGRPIGWEFAERYPHLYRDGPLPLTPSPCPVCGHATGNCTEEDHLMMAKATDAATSTPDDVRTALQGGRLTVEEVQARDAPGPGPAMVVVKEDVYEDVDDGPGTVTVRQRLRYHRGQVITEGEASAGKVQAVQQQDLRGGETK